VSTITELAFSADGELLASRGFREVNVWDVASGVLRHAIGGDDVLVQSMAFADATVLAFGDGQSRVRLFDVRAGAERPAIEIPTLDVRGRPAPLSALAFDPAGETMFVGSTNVIRVWDLAASRELRRLTGSEGRLERLVISPDGRRVFSAGHESLIRIWDSATGDELMSLRAGGQRVRGLALSPDGTRLAAVSDDQRLRIWDARPRP
ncbi:MAG: WD40 repeat domain-containing protein, partial [Planctomycetota bacterium]